MSKILLFCLLLSGVSASLKAQYADLLKNQNISWIAEYSTDFLLNPARCNWDVYSFANELNIIQLSANPAAKELFKEQHLESFFSQIITTAIRDGAFSTFEDEGLEIPISKEKLLERFATADTVASFDPETYEAKLVVVHNELGNKDFAAFRVRQVFYYDKSEKTFGSRLLAMAPLMQKFDDEGNFVDSLQAIVWLKIEDPPKNWDKAEPKGFSYVFETKMKGNAPRQSDFKPKKGRMDFLTLIVNEVAQPSHSVLDANFNLIASTKLQDFVLSTDTVITYNPETFEEQIQIVQRNALKDLEQISFVQQWFFDDRKRQLFNRVTAIAPMTAVRGGSDEDFRFSKVLFYLLNQ